MSTNVELFEESQLKQAIADVRKDSTETNWVLVSHKDGNPNVIALEATGTDGYDGLISHIKPDNVCYAILRVTTKVDLSVTVKFVYLHWIGEEVPFAKRGKFNIVHGAAVKHFQPYHVDFDITNKSEISEILIRDKVEMAAGNANYVRSADFAVGKPEFGKNQNQKVASNQALNKINPGSQPNLAGSVSDLSKKTPQGSSNNLKSASQNVATQASGASFDPAFAAAVKSVRDDKSSTKWVIGTFDGGNIKSPLVLKASGENASVEDIKPHFDPSQFSYALLRVIDVIDGHQTVKFVFISWIGNETSMMNKAKVATYKGSLQEHFAPFHVDFTISERREISDAAVKEKVSLASGSKAR